MLTDKIEELRKESQIVDEFLQHHYHFVCRNRESNVVKQLIKSIESIDMVAFRQLSATIREAEHLEKRIQRSRAKMKELAHLLRQRLNYQKIKR